MTSEKNKRSDDIATKNKMSLVNDNSFYIFKEDYTLFIYGDSLKFWLTIGGLIKGDVQIVWEAGTSYYRAAISSTIFFKFIYDQGNIFDVSASSFGYSIKMKVALIDVIS